jgi:uncharacterized protein (TIGR02996 family)
MPSDEAFLHDIVEHPDEDAPRLIYADWLDEHGRPERAEFIRVQCALAADPEDADLRRRERELLAEHGDAWRQEVPDWAREDCEFRRGFVAAVGCLVGDWLRHGDELVRRLPVEEVRFRRDPTAEPAALAGAPSLARLRSLILDYVPLGDAGLARLIGSPHLGRLTELWLPGNDLGAGGAALVAAAPRLAGLVILDLRDNDLGDAGARALTASRTLSGLGALQLVNTRVGDPGAEALASGPWRGLTQLYLGHNRIRDAGAQALARSAPASLRVLDLRANAVGNIGARALSGSAPLGDLELLDLEGNPIDIAGDLRQRFGHRVRL